MATLIILAGALVLVLILGATWLIVLAGTRQRTRPLRLPGFDRVMGQRSGTAPPHPQPPVPGDDE